MTINASTAAWRPLRATGLVSSSARLHGILPSTVQPFFARVYWRAMSEPTRPQAQAGVSGKWVVIGMVIGGVILALIALRYRQLEPLVSPSTSQPASSETQ
jgi:hypothetical protein